jgi:hypothetical protein
MIISLENNQFDENYSIKMFGVLFMFIHLHAKGSIHTNLQNIVPTSQNRPNDYCPGKSIDCCLIHKEDEDCKIIIDKCQNTVNSQEQDQCDEICDSYPSFEFCGSSSLNETRGSSVIMIVVIIFVICCCCASCCVSFCISCFECCTCKKLVLIHIQQV